MLHKNLFHQYVFSISFGVFTWKGGALFEFLCPFPSCFLLHFPSTFPLNIIQFFEARNM